MMGFGGSAPMFRIILAEVAADLAGAATGVLTTVQQSALALGVALLGALDAGPVSPLGFAGAAAVTVGVSGATGISVAVAARSLPQLRRAGEAQSCLASAAVTAGGAFTAGVGVRACAAAGTPKVPSAPASAAASIRSTEGLRAGWCELSIVMIIDTRDVGPAKRP
jgi:hypothetical protein